MPDLNNTTEVAAASSPFLWSLSNRQFIWRSNGHVVSTARLRDWVSQLVTETRAELRRIGERLIAGEINRAQWALDVGELLRNEHRALAMLANGGRANMDNATWGRLGQRLQSELSYFNHFASSVDNLELSDLGARFLTRLESYAEAGRFTYERSVRIREINAGDMLEQNVSGGSAQPCSECIEASDMGWVAAGTLSEPGTRECGPGCQCEIDYMPASAVNAESESEAA